MAQNGYGPAAGHIGRIPNYGKTQVNPMGAYEPPACIQNAMMTKDKKPFTYTPGGLDLSQIRTPSMARRLARQRSQEEHEQNYAQQPTNGGFHPQGGPAPPPPPPPPPKMPVPPPPPPIVIQVPNSKSPKPIVPGERPEIVIPENPIGMLRKTNSPYHWETEKAELQKLGNTPRYVDKVPSPLTVKMPPSTFTQQQPQSYNSPPSHNNFQRSPYGNQNKPESPIYRPEPQYSHQHSSSPQGSPPTREILQRQDSQFNKSPQPYAGQPINSGSPYSPSPNNNWRQPEKRDSPANSPHSASSNRSQFSPNVQQFSPNNQQYSPNNQQYSPNFQNQTPPTNSSPAFHTLPRVGQRNADVQNNNVTYNNTKPSPPAETNAAPWRTATLNRHPREQDSQQPIYNNTNSNQEQQIPPWKSNQATNNESAYVPPWKQENKAQQQYVPPWVNTQDANNNKVQENHAPWRTQEAPASPPKSNQQQEQPRYQSTMSIPVTPRKQNFQQEYNNTPQKEAVYVNEEPVYFCPESPKSIPPWVKTQKEKTKTPPPAWVQRPLEGRKSLSRELNTPPRDSNQEPEWVKKSNEMQRGAREVISPPKYQQPVQPSWSTRPSENRKSLPRDNAPSAAGTRVIPIQMEVSATETRDGRHSGHPQPQLRITIGMNNPSDQARAPFSPPTQRIMRVLSPQLVRMDDSNQQPELPTLNRTFQDSQPKTRIIPIQIEGGNGGANKSFGGRY
ncbi:pollen-specific leucine-rich repeat extensin-like protein 1 isoform X2 [Trichoplusia ni]|uniref:Pollen-specific leucine-rich repeat extensin-like protein 1 isoform X2 n=1 Tax=Trichoplusia ni TaxID=7111 RepID=A0A7E5W4F6_TRINI|nr:pollen-specific leucine-rich repeat extensin-like protein 1 isoform X2 [Trichoplusia ni]